MTIKTMPPIKALYFEAKTTLKGMDALVPNVAALYQDAARRQVFPCGPMYWFYFGADGNPDTEFTLQMVVPVSEKPREAGKFLYREVPAFKCSTELFAGKWDDLGGVYRRLIPETMAAGHSLVPTEECREMYVNADFEHPENCLTEVMIGIG